MKQFEIDHVEVSDYYIDVTYWMSEFDKNQSIMVKTNDFENWLKDQRDISLNVYWDRWNSKASDRLSSQIILDDVKQYLCFRFEMFKSAVETPAPSYTDQKPMTRVTGSRISDLKSKNSDDLKAQI